MGHRHWSRWLLLAMLGTAVAAGVLAYRGGRFSADALLANRKGLERAVAAAPALSAMLFVLADVVVTALSLPLATALALLAGALFGRGSGTLLVDIAATGGATLAFVASRYLLRDWLRTRMDAPPDPAGNGAKARRARARLRAWRAASVGIRASGLSYLLALRLLPIVPSAGVNIVSGVSPLPLRTFILGTCAGILPSTFLYVSAGATLGTLADPAGLVSLPALGTLALLGALSLFPVAWRRWRSA